MGKSTLAKLATDRPIIGTDAYKGLGESFGSPEAPLAMIRDTAQLDRFVIEGVLVARALRGPRVNGYRVPGMVVDAVVYLRTHKVQLDELLAGHITMAAGIETVFRQWQSTARIPVYEES
jgi:hypothetical protein